MDLTINLKILIMIVFKIHSLNGGPGGSSITVIQVILSARNIRSRHETKAFCTSSCDGLRKGR